METLDFDGVFRFTNWTDEDFAALWNNKEYMFPKGTCCPMIIPDETLENIQEIRKKWALKLAHREFYNGKEYKRLVALGNKSGGIPPTFDEKTLEPMIEKCLNPLPISKVTIKQGKKLDNENNFKASKAVGKNDNLAYQFKDDEPTAIGKQPDKAI